MSSPFRDPEAMRRRVRDYRIAARPGFSRDRRKPDPWPPPMRDSREDAPPYAEIEGHGLSWWIRVHHGVFIVGPDGGAHSHLGTRASAERRAARLVARVAREYERERAPKIVVQPIDPEAYRREEDRRALTAQALADLRDPVSAWDRAFTAAAPARRRWSLFGR